MKTTHTALALFIISVVLLNACAPQPSGDDIPEMTILVAPVIVECEGEGPQTCMLVKENPEDKWELFYDSINGFEFKEGYDSVIKVREEQVEDPPAGASSIRWILVELVSQEEVKPPEKLVIVGPNRVECEGEGPQLCMLVKESREGDWQLFYDQIEGFEFEEGYQYQIRVREEQVENPPAGGSSILWVLVDQYSKEKSPASDLEGVLWRMVSYRNADSEMVQSFPEVKSIAGFENGQVTGNTGCNNYNGTYDVDGNRISFGPMASTLMACPPPETEQEQGYLSALGMVSTFAVDGDNLEMMNEAGEVVLAYEAMESVSLTATPWIVSRYNNGRGGMTSVIIGTEITANFTEDGVVSGSAGCNSYNAPFEAEEDMISIGLVAVTQKLCSEPEGMMEQEAEYLSALQNAAVYTISEDRIEIRDEGGSGVVFFVIAGDNG